MLCCEKSFISFGVLHQTDRWHYTGCLHFSAVSSFVVFLVSDSFLSLILVSDCRTDGDVCTLGRDFLSVCDIKYAHLLSLNKVFSLFSFHVFCQSFSTSPITHTRNPTPLGPNHCKQQIVVNASPRSACCCVAKRKKKQICALWYF